MATMSSREYWAERETENLKQNLKSEAEYMKEIEDIYKYTMDQVQKEIDSFYAKYASKEGISIAEAKKRASKLDMEEYSRKAKKYVKEKNFSKQANDEMRLYNLTMKVNRLELLKAQIGLELVAGFDELQQFYDEKLTERTLEEFQRQAGILGFTILDNAKMAEAIVNASFKNATFSERIWTHQDLLRAELDKLLQTGLVQGRNPRELARQLRKAFDASVFNSERLLRTELARVQTEAQKQSFIRNGFDQYTFIAAADHKVCSICKAINGSHYDVDKMMPGENAPPMHPLCRCSTAAYIDDKSYEEWLSGYKDHGLSFAEWKAKKSKKGIVSKLSSYTHNGSTYKVDGKYVVLDYTEKELEVATLLANKLNANVQMVPRVAYPQNISTPDYLIDGERYDLKTPKGSGKNVLYGMLQKKKRQSDNFIFDVSECPLSMKEIKRQIDSIYKSSHMKFINHIILIKNGEIEETYAREK